MYELFLTSLRVLKPKREKIIDIKGFVFLSLCETLAFYCHCNVKTLFYFPQKHAQGSTFITFSKLRITKKQADNIFARSDCFIKHQTVNILHLSSHRLSLTQGRKMNKTFKIVSSVYSEKNCHP